MTQANVRSYGQPYAIIPVNFENEYTKLDLDGGVDNVTHYYGGFLGVDFLHDPRFFRTSSKMKSFAIDRLYHQKNLYLMNNNGGRNTSLKFGKALGCEWTMVFDGNCFMTKDGMQSIVQDIVRYGTRPEIPLYFNKDFYNLNNLTTTNITTDPFYDCPFIRKKKSSNVFGNITSTEIPPSTLYTNFTISDKCSQENSTSLLGNLEGCIKKTSTNITENSTGASTNVWTQISSGEFKTRNVQYFIIPMARILNNTNLLNYDKKMQTAAFEPTSQENNAKKGWIPNASEEPQIIFRRDSAEEFDEDIRYGRRPKVELLWRLGVPKTSFFLKPLPWESEFMDKYDIDVLFAGTMNKAKSLNKKKKSELLTNNISCNSPVIKKYRASGWTARLFSGNSNQEKSEEDGSKSRNSNRMAGIHEFIDQVDSTLLQHHEKLSWKPDQPFFFNSLDKLSIFGIYSKEMLFDAAKSLINQEILIKNRKNHIQFGPWSPRVRLLSHGWPSFADIPSKKDNIISDSIAIESLLKDSIILLFAARETGERNHFLLAVEYLKLVMNHPEMKELENRIWLCGQDETCMKMFLTEENKRPAEHNSSDATSTIKKTPINSIKIEEDDYVIREEGKCFWGKNVVQRPQILSFLRLLVFLGYSYQTI